MTGWVEAGAAAAAAAAMVWAATPLLRRLLLRAAVIDTPNPRSSHAVPTPRGGGIAVVGAIALCWGALLLWTAPDPAAARPVWIVLGGAGALAALSFADDLFDLPAALRMAAQAVVVGTGLLALPADSPVAQGLLPMWADRALAWLAWLWFVNLFNFMDGIDGIAGAETVAVALGIGVVLALGPGGDGGITLALSGAVAGAAAGFLWWNWHPARIFLGDVGSVPLGYLLGWLLLGLAADGAWAAALILPLYYLVDATLTLARRAARGERVWRAHREHFYQRAVQGGLRHDQVTLRITGLNALLIVLAAASVGVGAWAQAGCVAAALLLALALAGRFAAAVRR